MNFLSSMTIICVAEIAESGRLLIQEPARIARFRGSNVR